MPRGGPRPGAGRKQRRGGKPASFARKKQQLGRQLKRHGIQNVMRGPKRPTRLPSPLKYKRKKKKVEVISRRTQRYWRRKVEARILSKQDVDVRPVSSSWISHLGYSKKLIRGIAIMHTYYKNKTYEYEIKLPFKVFNAWYMAHSKGTFFNVRIRDKYKITRVS